MLCVDLRLRDSFYVFVMKQFLMYISACRISCVMKGIALTLPSYACLCHCHM